MSDPVGMLVAVLAVTWLLTLVWVVVRVLDQIENRYR